MVQLNSNGKDCSLYSRRLRIKSWHIPWYHLNLDTTISHINYK